MEKAISNVPATAMSTMQLLNNTEIDKIIDLDFVKSKFITTFNICNSSDMGELVYARNMLHIKSILAKMQDKNTIDKLSVLHCYLTIAEKGWSVNPIDKEIYLIPRKGQLCIQPQEQAYVKRLILTKQVQYAQKSELVYSGDEFKVSKGRVLEHIRAFKSDKIIAGYKIFILNDGITERHFIYYPEHWEVWRASSPQPNGANWKALRLEDDGKSWTATNQPKVPFLETKIGTHAANSNVWSTTAPPPSVEVHGNVIISDEEIDYSEEIPQKPNAAPAQTVAGNAEQQPEAQPASETKAALSFLKKKEETSGAQPF